MSDVPEIDKLRRQQTAIADFGTFAIHEHDLQKILSEAARVCAEGLGTKFSKICRYRATEGDLLIVAGHGWRSGLIGKVVSKADASSPQGRAFVSGNPAICENLLEDKTYELPSFYKDHGIISTIDVLIKGSQGSYGVLEVDSDVFFVFDQQDIIYLTGFANILAEALAASEQRAREAEYAKEAEELKAQAVEIRIAGEAAHRTAKARTTFIATMSHEIRTPLNAILGFSELLAETPLTPDQSLYVSILQENTAHLSTLVDDILDYAKIESGKIPFRKAPFVIRDLVFSVENTTKMLVSGRPISVDVFIDSEVSRVFIGDVDRIRQVLLNMLSNSAKFTNAGAISIRVTEKIRHPDCPVIRFQVQDTGVGIDPKHHDDVFDFYERVEAREDAGVESSGIGLSIGQAIVKRMGGSIGFESEVGKGSTFWFEIPLQIAQQVPHATSHLEVAGTVDGGGQKNLQILIADDSKASCMLLKIWLQKLGHTVTICENGAEAVNAARRKRFDYLFVDLQMPVMGGVEATRIIRALGGDAGVKNIIALTANAFPEQIEEARAAGIDDVIYKPFNKSKLIELFAKAE
jgi:signal transduction histidine kinase